MMTGGLATTMERQVSSPPTMLSLTRKANMRKSMARITDDRPSRFGLVDIWLLVGC